MIALENLNPSQIGDITELKCQVYLIEQGWNVLIPIGNHQKYDLVIEKNGKFYMFPVFGTTETKFWTVGTRLTTQKQAKDFRAEDILFTL